MAISLRLIRRAGVAYAHDIGVTALSFFAALYLRLGNELFVWDWTVFWLADAILVAIAAGVFWFSGLYRGIWRYASLGRHVLHCARRYTDPAAVPASDVSGQPA